MNILNVQSFSHRKQTKKYRKRYINTNDYWILIPFFVQSNALWNTTWQKRKSVEAHLNKWINK